MTRRLGVRVLIVSCVLLLAQACSGGDPTTPPVEEADGGASDATTTTPTDASSSADDGAAGGGECTTNDDCTAKLPVTTPENCAVAICDVLQKKCHFKAKDADDDGHPAKKCTASTTTIENGDDCDDDDPKSYPGAWDGPATDSDAGSGALADRCDERDNDCNGSPDDGKITVDGGTKTCRCDPNKPLPCYEYSNGTPIDPATLGLDNAPRGVCRKGTRTCVQGVPGTCSGAVGPAAAEQCDTLDNDCDGTSGNAGDTVATAPLWYKDSDNDNYGDSTIAPKQQCVSPAGFWKQVIPNTDCDDGDGQRNPGRTEVCDGKDNNCNNNVDEGVTSTFCADVDGDGYCTTTCLQACAAPAGYRAQATCLPGVDCTDTAGAGASINPGATELCGDGVNSNCSVDGADSETYPNLNVGCSTLGNFGVCRRTGKYVCALPARTSTTCDATAGTAGAAATLMSIDPLIDMGQVRSDYDPRWDHDCSNAITVVSKLYGGTFRNAACSGNYALACEQFAGQPECDEGTPFFRKQFICDKDASGNYLDPTTQAVCGRTMVRIGCIWTLPSPGHGKCNFSESLATVGAISCQ